MYAKNTSGDLAASRQSFGIEFRRLADKHHRAGLGGPFGDLPLGVLADQAEASHWRGHRGKRQRDGRIVDGNIRLGDVVKNFLAKKILVESARIAMKRRLGLRRAVEMFPRLGRRFAPHDLAQIAKSHLFEWFFAHENLSSEKPLPSSWCRITEAKRRRAVIFL